MIPRFSYAKPRTLAEAFDMYTSADGGAAYIAGGTELLQVMKMGFAQFETLIDLKGLGELRGIANADSSLRIGAASTHREVERSGVVRDQLPGLASLERRVANIRVRSTGTLGGNLAFAEPHSDPATFLLACDARVDLSGPTGDRSLSIADFVIGPLATARDPEEILIAIRVPTAGPGEGRAYDKFAFFERPAASVAVQLSVHDGVIIGATVALGSLTEAPTIVEPAGAAFVGAPADLAALDGPVAAAVAALQNVDAAADLNGSADYKRHLAGVLIGRTARVALQEAVAHA